MPYKRTYAIFSHTINLLKALNVTTHVYYNKFQLLNCIITNKSFIL